MFGFSKKLPAAFYIGETLVRRSNKGNSFMYV